MSAVADLIGARRERILQLWTERLVALGEHAASTGELVNAVPSLLDDLVRALRRGGGADLPSDAPAVAAEHGAQRHARRIASLTQLLREYDLLFDAILAVAEEAGVALPLGELRALAAELGRCTAAGASEYVADRERALGEALSLVDTLVERAPAALGFVDRELRFVRVNGAMAELAGAPPGDIVGRTVDEVARPELAARLAPELRAVLARGEPREPLEVSDGDRDYLVSLNPVPGQHGEPQLVAALAVDITDRRRRERELQGARDFERQLIGIVSHDLRTPLHAARLSAEVALRHRDLDPRVRPVLVRVQSATDRALRLVADLLDFTRARLGGGIPVTPRRAELGAIVRSAADDAHAAFPGRELRLELPAPVDGAWDADRVAQAVGNLVTNALKYGEPDEPVVVRVGRDGGDALVEVRNGGPPLPAELVPQLFEPLKRGPTAAAGGVGLGLYIVRAIAEAHGGDVHVASSEAAGTSFTLRLPLRSASG